MTAPAMRPTLPHGYKVHHDALTFVWTLSLKGATVATLYSNGMVKVHGVDTSILLTFLQIAGRLDHTLKGVQ